MELSLVQNNVDALRIRLVSEMALRNVEWEGIDSEESSSYELNGVVMAPFLSSRTIDGALVERVWMHLPVGLPHVPAERVCIEYAWYVDKQSSDIKLILVSVDEFVDYFFHQLGTFTP